MELNQNRQQEDPLSDLDTFISLDRMTSLGGESRRRALIILNQFDSKFIKPTNDENEPQAKKAKKFVRGYRRNGRK